MAQKYADPVAHERMAANTCPECGQLAEHHSGAVEFWLRGPGCDLLPRGVRERIDQYRADAGAGRHIFRPAERSAEFPD